MARICLWCLHLRTLTNVHENRQKTRKSSLVISLPNLKWLSRHWKPSDIVSQQSLAFLAKENWQVLWVASCAYGWGRLTDTPCFNKTSKSPVLQINTLFLLHPSHFHYCQSRETFGRSQHLLSHMLDSGANVHEGVSTVGREKAEESWQPMLSAAWVGINSVHRLWFCGLTPHCHWKGTQTVICLVFTECLLYARQYFRHWKFNDWYKSFCLWGDLSCVVEMNKQTLGDRLHFTN